MTPTDPRRAIPSVSIMLEMPAVQRLLEHAPRPLVVDSVREVLEDARRNAQNPQADWSLAVEHALQRRLRPSLRPVLNATGVVLHTNLGRAPLASAARDAIRDCASGYTNLEYDLDAGERGSRYVHCTALLQEITGAEQALVVNNCAAALVLALNTLADGREAIVSRGELVEIGGSFRVPEIMTRSGARLVEVGTTNRTTAADYRNAISGATGAIVKVHRSNFAVSGFVAEASVSELVALGDEHGLPVIQDFGSGLMLPLDAFGLAGEQTAAQMVAANPAVVLMSGDKLLGGPQAGIVLGRAEVVQRLAKNPLARALRVDKLTLAALEATLAIYREPGRAVREIPVLAMLTCRPEDVRARATHLASLLEASGVAASVGTVESSVGGGAFPTARIPSCAVLLDGHAKGIEARLRSGRLPVIARIADGRVVLDLRTIPAEHDEDLARTLLAALVQP